MKTSRQYFQESLKELGASRENGVPINAVVELALIKAMRDFMFELWQMKEKEIKEVRNNGN